jgi:hypothetical protein
MPKCVYCNSEFAQERVDLGLDYCLSDECQSKGLNETKRKFLQEYTPALLHKSNYFWVKKTQLKDLNVRPDLDR